MRDDIGNKNISTTVHMPLGGHLLDIERQFAVDGSISKKVRGCVLLTNLKSAFNYLAKFIMTVLLIALKMHIYYEVN